MNNVLLSICVPTFNRANKLVRLIRSIDIEKDIELVICDDGSTDNTLELIKISSTKIKFIYEYQENKGRGFALKKSIQMAKGKYVIVMDSDDYFIPNALANICWILSTQRAYKSFVFGIKIFKKNIYVPNLPPDVESNFSSLRGDYGVKNDLKEVVRRDILVSCLYSESITCRRVPTLLLWSSVAEKVNCLSISIPVAVNEYLPDGMTSNGFLLRMECTIPMAELYFGLINSTSYKSNSYRWLMRVMWARYAFHAKKIEYKNLRMKLVLIPGFCIFLIDKFILLSFFGSKND